MNQHRMNAISEPDIYMLKSFADFFHTSVDYIIGYTDSPLPYNDNSIFLEKKCNSNELHHLYLYQHLAPHVQSHIDASMEELAQDNTATEQFDKNLPS